MTVASRAMMGLGTYPVRKCGGLFSSCSRRLAPRSIRARSSPCSVAPFGQSRQLLGNAGESKAPTPLFLWLGNRDQANLPSRSTATQITVPLLLPVDPPSLHSAASLDSQLGNGVLVVTAEDALDRVNAHYGADDSGREDSSSSDYQQFVGGMGESDPGVWFAAASGTSQGDALAQAELIAEAIHAVKEVRHGVPIGVYTTGWISDADDLTVPWADLLRGVVDCLQVSLHASTPQQYHKSTGLTDPGEATKAFGTVCGFIAEAVEQGFPVEAWVRSEFAGPSRDLALSLGARQVHDLR